MNRGDDGLGVALALSGGQGGIYLAMQKNSTDFFSPIFLDGTFFSLETAAADVILLH